MVSAERFPIEIEDASGGGKGLPDMAALVRKSVT